MAENSDCIEHEFILDCDTGMLTGYMYCLKCGKSKCNHQLAEFGVIDGEKIYDWYCQYCKKWEWDW